MSSDSDLFREMLAVRMNIGQKAQEFFDASEADPSDVDASTTISKEKSAATSKSLTGDTDAGSSLAAALAGMKQQGAHPSSLFTDGDRELLSLLESEMDEMKLQLLQRVTKYIFETRMLMRETATIVEREVDSATSMLETETAARKKAETEAADLRRRLASTEKELRILRESH